MHVSSFGYCSQLNFNSECQCIVLIIFLHEAFVAIEKEIEPVDESMIWWNMQSSFLRICRVRAP
jgi:hypothetical protein